MKVLYFLIAGIFCLAGVVCCESLGTPQPVNIQKTSCSRSELKEKNANLLMAGTKEINTTMKGLCRLQDSFLAAGESLIYEEKGTVFSAGSAQELEELRTVLEEISTQLHDVSRKIEKYHNQVRSIISRDTKSNLSRPVLRVEKKTLNHTKPIVTERSP
jgi:hypothetical protein